MGEHEAKAGVREKRNPRSGQVILVSCWPNSDIEVETSINWRQTRQLAKDIRAKITRRRLKVTIGENGNIEARVVLVGTRREDG